MEVQPWTRRLGLGIAVALLSACSGTLADAPIAREEIDPQVLGSWPMHGGGEPFSVATYQGYAYVSAGGIQYVDIRDPKRPRVTGGYPAPAFSRGDIVVSGRRLYSCQGNGGLVILDLTDPAQPTQVGLFRTDAQTVAADGNRVYVGTSDSVQFLDVSDVAHPRLFGGWRVPTPQPPVASIAISGRYAYLAAPFSGVWIIDADAVGGPKEFARIGLSSQLSQPWGVTVAGGLAYVADWQLGLVIFDVSDPSRPVARGKLATRSPAVQVVVSGSYAFVCEREDGVEIVDIRDPRRPVSIGRYDTPGEAWEINLQGTVACVADRMA